MVFKYYLMNKDLNIFEEIGTPAKFLPGETYKIEKYQNNFFLDSCENENLEHISTKEIKVLENGIREERNDFYWNNKITETNYIRFISEMEKYYHRENGPAIIFYFEDGSKRREIYKYRGIDYSENGLFESKYTNDGIFRVDYYNYLDFLDFETTRHVRYFKDKPLIVVYKNNIEFCKVYGILDICIQEEKIDYQITPHRIVDSALTGEKGMIDWFTDDRGRIVMNNAYDILLNEIKSDVNFWNRKEGFASRFAVCGNVLQKNKFYNYKWIWRRCLRRYFNKFKPQDRV